MIKPTSAGHDCIICIEVNVEAVPLHSTLFTFDLYKRWLFFFFSVLETEKSLVLAEKGSGDNNDVELIRAAESFRLVATMNPGGDFGKKEVSWKTMRISFQCFSF